MHNHWICKWVKVNAGNHFEVVKSKTHWTDNEHIECRLFERGQNEPLIFGFYLVTKKLLEL